MLLASHDLAILETVSAVIGVDEAGRGPLAGPVSAAAVCLDRAFFASKWFYDFGSEINDSKQISESTREKIFEAILEAEEGLIYSASFMSSVEDIEELNILGATRKAMARCIRQLLTSKSCPVNELTEGEGLSSGSASRQGGLFQKKGGASVARVLIDGRPLKPFPFEHSAIVKGDGKSLAIALASIIAKVTRDRFMRQQANVYPDYGFSTNKGYGTARHIAALRACGPCKLHRMSFLSQILGVR